MKHSGSSGIGPGSKFDSRRYCLLEVLNLAIPYAIGEVDKTLVQSDIQTFMREFVVRGKGRNDKHIVLHKQVNHIIRQFRCVLNGASPRDDCGPGRCRWV